MTISPTTQAAEQLTHFTRHNKAAATATLLAAKTSAGAVSQLTTLLGGLEMLQQTTENAKTLGRHLDITA